MIWPTVLLGLFVGVVLWAYVTGRKAERGDAAEDGLDAASDANRIREDVRRLTDGALDDELRKHARPVREPGGDQP